MILFIFECLMIIATSEVSAAGLTIKTNSGVVVGTHIKSYEGRPVSAFQGVPYAKPPVGPLRFRAPQPVEQWTGELLTNTTYTCIHAFPLNKVRSILGTEDCLYLYIYVPIEHIAGNENLDVVIGMHAGAFMMGDPHTYCGPHYLMDRNLIYITMTYRLGILGFLSTEDEASPGNYGLKDQVMAFRWVKDNIKYFGGNPNSITITGSSAGAASVQYHYISPMSKGLFHRGYSQSGSVLNTWALTKNCREKAKKLASYHNCSDDSAPKMVDCLRQIQAETLIDSLQYFYAALNLMPLAPFGPCIEKSATPFLPDHPYRLLRNGLVNDVPWIVSNTKEEGIYPVALVVLYKNLRKLDSNWDEMVSYAMDYNDTVNIEDRAIVGRKLREFYFNKENLTLDNLPQLIHMFGDRLFIVDAEKAIRLHIKVSKSPCYLYLMDYRLDIKWIIPSTVHGTAHLDDARLLYHIIGNPPKLTERDAKMKNIFIDFLSNFASGRAPKFGNTVWKPLQAALPPGDLNYMRVSGADDIQMKTNKELGPTEFYNSLPFKENDKLF